MMMREICSLSAPSVLDSVAEADLVALKKASQSLDKLLSAQGVDVEDIVADFKKARKKSAPATSAKAK